MIAIQFIQPVPNNSRQITEMDISKIHSVPVKVQAILKNSCYDCHSNHTRYPWYAYIQPGGWWLASHIKEGKAKLNFSEFGGYSKRRQQSKLKSIIGSIKDETMPLPSYTLIHRNARLSETEKVLILGWVKRTNESFK